MKALWGEAPAKVNVALAVTGRREDGYHELRSVFLRLALHDHLEIVAADDPGGPDELVIEGDVGLSVRGNLVLRALEGLRSSADRPLPAVRVRLHKRIPVAAGLAGGSSDAATILELATRAWALPWDHAGRLALAVRLGADVPFFVSGFPAALVSGIGGSVEPLPTPDPPAGVLLATLAGRLSTAAVFAEWDRQHDLGLARPDGGTITRPDELADELAIALRNRLDGAGLAALAPRLREANDLWSAAARLSPDLRIARDVLENALDRAFLLTGSGPTLFAIYPTPEAAAEAAAKLRAADHPLLRDAAINVSATSPGEDDREGTHPVNRGTQAVGSLQPGDRP